MQAYDLCNLESDEAQKARQLSGFGSDGLLMVCFALIGSSDWLFYRECCYEIDKARSLFWILRLGVKLD